MVDDRLIRDHFDETEVWREVAEVSGEMVAMLTCKHCYFQTDSKPEAWEHLQAEHADVVAPES